MKSSAFIWFSIFLFWIPIHLGAQQRNSAEINLNLSVREVAVVDFQSSNKLVSGNVGESGGRVIEQILTPGTEFTWINYTSIVSEGASNHISASISGYLPADVVIKLKVSDDAGEGQGELGLPVEELTLNSYPQNIITNIGSCYTGRGMKKGHRLTFVWEDSNGNPITSDLDANLSVSVTYTIASTQ